MNKQGPEVSVVIPVVERHGDLRALLHGFRVEIESTGKSVEYLFIVDARQREVLPELRRIQADSKDEIVLYVLGGHFGESAALSIGLEKARGEIIVTLASYPQVDAVSTRRAVTLVESGETDMVVGWRHPRIDSWFNQLQSRLFHWLVNRLTGTHFHDLSCGFRILSRETAEAIQVYGGLHRFLPILVQELGLRVQELPLPQHEDDSGTRYFGVALYLKRLVDVLTVFFLTKFTRRPLRFFGLVGLTLAVPGALITLYLGAYRLLQLGPIAGRPLLLLGVLLMVLGLQSLSLGLVGEIIIFTHARSVRDYHIAEVISRDDGRARVLPMP